MAKPASQNKSELSYISCVGKIPFIYRTLGQQLSIVAKEDRDREAFVFVKENKRITYGQLLIEADRLAAGLKCLGLKKGDRLCVITPNVPTWPITFYAAARAGFILVFINPTFSAEEIEKCLKKVSAKALISAEKFGDTSFSGRLLEILANSSEKLPFLSSIIIDSDKSYDGILRLMDVMALPTFDQISSIEDQQKDICPDSGCNILFTSGFTGSPKGVLLSHFNAINIGFNVGRLELDKSIMCMPLQCCHIFSYWITIAANTTRSTIVVPNFYYDPEATLLAINIEKCSFVFAMPKMFLELLSKKRELKLSIKEGLIAVMGGSTCSPEQYVQLKKELGISKIKMCYGQTEITGLSFMPLVDATDEQLLNLTGHILDNLELKIIDSDGNLVPFGTPGELCVRGYCTMMKYWEDEEKTKEVLGDDGWFKTGDCFILQENGYGKFLARISDIIKKGTEQIFPKEIEDILISCPGVAEAYVIGIKDEHWGEEVCAFIICQDENSSITVQDLQEFCKGKLSPTKIPRYIQFVKNVPKTLSGKVKKWELKEQFLSKTLSITNTAST